MHYSPNNPPKSKCRLILSNHVPTAGAPNCLGLARCSGSSSIRFTHSNLDECSLKCLCNTTSELYLQFGNMNKAKLFASRCNTYPKLS